MRTKFTFKTQKLFATVALAAAFLGALTAKAQDLRFKAGTTYYIDGVGVDLVAPKDTFISLGGTTTVYTGGNYTSSTGIFPALSINGIDSNTLGQLTILLVPGYTGVETIFPVLKGVPYSSPSRPVVLKPSQGNSYTITRSTAVPNTEAVIRMEGTQFFTIDGESVAGQRNITFMIPAANSSNTTARVVDIVTNQNQALANSLTRDVTVKNCNILGTLNGVNANIAAGVLVGSTGGVNTQSVRRAENVSIINCNIQNVQFGIYVRGVLGTSAGLQDKGLVIRNNIIGGAPNSYLGGASMSVVPSMAGIYLANQANAVVEGNTISKCSPTSLGFAGIVLHTPSGSSIDSNVVINANKIHSLNLTGTTTMGVFGIRVNHTISHSQDLGIVISNNAISNISSTSVNPTVATINTPTFPIGISVEDVSANAGVDLYNNSVSMSGATLHGAASACVFISSTVTGGVQLRNNLLSNRMENISIMNPLNLPTVANPYYHIAAVIVAGLTEPFDSCDNNLYDVSTTGGWAHVGHNATTGFASLSEWRSFTRDDENSITDMPVFDDPLTLITNNNAPARYGSMGKTILPTDITGASRPSAYHSIGAYQFTQNTANAPSRLKVGATYYINGTTSYPTESAPTSGSFRNIAEFVDFLNAFGTDSTGIIGQRVNVVIQNGYNTGPGDTSVIPAVRPYPGMGGSVQLTLSLEAGINVTVKLNAGRTIPNNSALFRLYGVQGFTLDGRGPAGQRMLTFQLPSSAVSTTAKVMVMAPSVLTNLQRNIVQGCNFIGATTLSTLTSTIYTQVGLYVGHPFIASGLGSCIGGSNIFNSIADNYIGGTKNGIYWRSRNGFADDNNNIYRNWIGGGTDTANGVTHYIGGATDQAGLYIKGFSQGLLDSNVIRNSHPGFTGFRGIDLDGTTEAGKSAGLTVTRNTIYNLGCNLLVAGGYAAGIKVGLNAPGLNLRITNNFIAKIYGQGSPNLSALTSPVGIWFDNIIPTASMNIGAYVAHNTVHLSQAKVDLHQNSGVSTAIHLGSGHTGVTLRNNIFSNTMGRATYVPSGSYTAAITFASAPGSAPLNLDNTRGNIYYAKGKNSFSFTGLRQTTGFPLFGLQDLFDYMGFSPTTNPPKLPDFGMSAWGEVPFLSDTGITMNLMYVGHIARNPNNTYDGVVDRDILGVPRGSNMISVGALQFTTPYVPLKPAIYHVDGVNAPPTDGVPDGYFSTINNLFRYINTNGVDGITPPLDSITVLIGSSYAGEGDTLITPLHDYPRMSSNRWINIRPAPGVSPVITSTAATANSAFDGMSSVIKFMGASYVTIDGSNNGTNSRDLTIRIPADNGSNTANINHQFARVVDVIGWNRPATNNTIKNCNIIGNSTSAGINTFAGIYQGGVNMGVINSNVPLDAVRSKNDNNTYRNNYITAVKYGIRLVGRSAEAGGQDMNTRVLSNIIGGNTNIGGGTPTDYFGGIVNAAGISASAQARLVIDSNVIRNNIRSFANNSGIELIPGTSQLATDSMVTISRNIIKDIQTTSTTAGSSGAFGVYINMMWNLKKSFNIINNMISGISAPGSIPTSNPYGIFLNGTTVTPTVEHDVNIYNNSISLGAASVMSPTAVSSCIALMNGVNTRVQVRLENNILQNKLTRTAAGGPIYAIYAMYDGNPFFECDNNNYYVNGANSVNHIAGVNSNAVKNHTTLESWVGLTKQDTMSMNYPAPFTSDNDLFIPAGTASPLYRAGSRKAIVNNDVLGTPRPAISAFAATIGAHEFTGSYADSAAPRIYDFTGNPSCFEMPWGFELVSRVYDRNPVLNDTLYYRLAGATADSILLPTSINGFERRYYIPGVPDNTFIEYRYSTTDGSGKSSVFVNALSTGTRFFSGRVSNFPVSTGFDLPNYYGWQVQQISGATSWNIESFGSQSNPFLFPQTGTKAAILPATPVGPGNPLGSVAAVSRLLSPCLDLVTNVKIPTLRLYVSQNFDNDINKDRVNDSIAIKLISFNEAPINHNPIVRVNQEFTTPGYKVYDVCLPQFQDVRVAIDGYSKAGGAAILIDSIVIFDNFSDNVVTPTIQDNCFNDSFTVFVQNSSPQNMYYVHDELTDYRGPLVRGNGGTLAVQGYMPSVDEAIIRVGYVNITSNCDVYDNGRIYELQNVARIRFGTFKNGPFVKKNEAHFNGMFNDGDVANPDAVKIGGDADYEISPPGSATNADYGVTWEVAQAYVRNLATGNLEPGRLSIIPGNSGSPAYVRFKGDTVDNNKLYLMSIVLRLLPNGCDSIVSRYVRVAFAPKVEFYAYSDSVCAGEGVLFQNASTNEAATLPVNFFWDFGDGTTSTLRTPVKQFANPGSYTVTLRAGNKSTLMDSASFIWVVKESPEASFTSTLPCAGKVVTYTNTSTGNGLTYDWNFAGQVTTDKEGVVVFPYSDTTVAVRLITTNDQGCRDTAFVPTTVFAQPTASFDANNVCAGAAVQFANASSIDPGKNGRVNTIGSEWNFGNGDIGYSTSPLYQYPAGGTYLVKLKVTSNFGCVDTISKTVSVYEKPVPSFTVNNACRATSLDIVNNTTYAGGLDKVLFNWNFGDNSQPQDAFTPSKQYGEARPFIITLRVIDTVNYCVDSMVQTVTIRESAKAEFLAENGCVGAEVQFTNISVVPAGVEPAFSWNFGDNGTDTIASPKHTYTSGGDKVVTFTVDIQGCQSVARDTISISDATPISFTSELRSDSFTVDFIASLDAFDKYTWDFGDGSNSVKGPGQTTTSNIFPREGKYRVTLVATDANGCTSVYSDSVLIWKTVGLNNDAAAAKFNFNLYPNPFTTSAQVMFEMDKNNEVLIEVFDMIGRRVYVKNNGVLSAGKHVIGFNEGEFSAVAGAYLVKVKIGNEVITRHLIRQ